MKYVCILFAGLLTIAYGHPSGSEPQPATLEAQLNDLITQAQASISNVGKELQEKLNLPNQETVVNTIKTQSTNLVENVQNYIKQVSEDVKSKSPELQKDWENVKTKLTQVVNDINAQIPNAKEHATQLQDVFTRGLNVLVEESGKVAKTINDNTAKVQEELAKFTKEAVQIAVQTTNNLNEQLKKAAETEAPKN